MERDEVAQVMIFAIHWYIFRQHIAGLVINPWDLADLYIKFFGGESG